MPNPKYSKEEIEKMLNNSTEEIIEDNEYITDEFDNQHNVNKIIKEAETHIKKKYPKVNFRCSEFEIARAKKIAGQLGLHYQT